MKTALSVKNLTIEIDGHTIINNISFAVDQGSTTAIIGPNGAGKSILVKSLLRLIPKKDGEVTILETPQKQYKKIADQVSYIPQSLNFDRDFPLTVRDLFTLKSTKYLGMAKEEEASMHKLLEQVQMSPFINARLATLSGGQLQRVLIAYSLTTDPKLLILDEPSSGVDVSGQETIYELLHRIQEERQLTLILISHELDIVMKYADQVLCLNKELLCAGVPKEVLSPDMLQKMYGVGTGHFSHHGHGH